MTETNNLLSLKANALTTYTKTEIDNSNNTNFYTRTQILDNFYNKQNVVDIVETKQTKIINGTYNNYQLLLGDTLNGLAGGTDITLSRVWDSPGDKFANNDDVLISFNRAYQNTQFALKQDKLDRGDLSILIHSANSSEILQLTQDVPTNGCYINFRISNNAKEWKTGLRPGTDHCNWLLNNVMKKTLFGDGSIWIAGTYSSASDARLKTDIDCVNNEALSTVFDAIEVKSYKKKDDDSEACELGFIADDVEEAIEANGLCFDNLVKKNDDDMRSLAYDRMVCILWGACKEMKAEIATLKEQIKHL